jgi:hypothetical protein
MPRYVITFERTVAQVARLEIEAESMEDARDQADTLEDEFDSDAVKLDWVDDPADCESGHCVEWDRVELIEED